MVLQVRRALDPGVERELPGGKAPQEAMLRWRERWREKYPQRAACIPGGRTERRS